MDGRTEGKDNAIKERVSLSWSYKLPKERGIGSGQIFSLHNVILYKYAILIATIEADTGHCSRQAISSHGVAVPNYGFRCFSWTPVFSCRLASSTKVVLRCGINCHICYFDSAVDIVY